MSALLGGYAVELQWDKGGGGETNETRPVFNWEPINNVIFAIDNVTVVDKVWHPVNNT